MITASWPLARKDESSIQLAEERGVPVTVVLRKKPEEAAQTTRRFFVAAIKRELPEIAEKMAASVGIMDLRASIIGQALNIYSRYRTILDADGTPLKPHIASRIIEQELDTILSPLYIEKKENKEESSNGRES